MSGTLVRKGECGAVSFAANRMYSREASPFNLCDQIH